MIFCVCETFSRETVAAPSRPRMITSRRHPLFFFFGPPTRPTTHTPHNTRSRGVKNRGAPDQNHRFATGLARAHGFWVLRSSRQVGAGSRGRVTTDGSPTSHPNSVVSQNSGAPVQRRATQPRPCARADTTRPATANYPPVRKECLSRGFPSKEPPQQFHHITICTSHHHIIVHYIARTDRPDGRRVTRHLEKILVRGCLTRHPLFCALNLPLRLTKTSVEHNNNFCRLRPEAFSFSHTPGWRPHALSSLLPCWQ